MIVKMRINSLCSASYISWQRDTAGISAERRVAVRRAAALLSGHRYRLISPAHWAHSSKPAAVACSGQ